MNKWEKCLGVKFPTCKMTGLCCRVASPSLPVIELIKKAAEGDSFARDFLCLFVPYQSIEEARAISFEVVENSLMQAEKSSKFQSKDQVVFFRCRYLEGKNKCLVYEDRPQLCRDYPDTPFIVMPQDCGFKEWSKECKKKYADLAKDFENLKQMQEILKCSPVEKLNPVRITMYTTFLISPSYSWLR